MLSSEQGKAIDLAYSIASLLSVACRGNVFVVTQQLFDANENCVGSMFQEPSFTEPAWGRPLIPDTAVTNFIETAYPHLDAKYEKLELGGVIDDYIQALKLRSAWPSSLGIFTAMEALRAAYFHSPNDMSLLYWVVPEENFAKEDKMFNEILDVLSKYFPRFNSSSLSKQEKESFKAQLKGLNRRSYKTQLSAMLDQLGVTYTSKELRSFIDIRNIIIHQGLPATGIISEEEYDKASREAWQRVKRAISLFEKAILHVLGYTGKHELFEQGQEQ